MHGWRITRRASSLSNSLVRPPRLEGAQARFGPLTELACAPSKWEAVVRPPTLEGAQARFFPWQTSVVRPPSAVAWVYIWPWCACAPDVIASLACSRPWLIPSPRATGAKIGTYSDDIWRQVSHKVKGACAPSNLSPYPLSSGGEAWRAHKRGSPEKVMVRSDPNFNTMFRFLEFWGRFLILRCLFSHFLIYV